MTVDFDRRVEAFSSYNIDVDEAHSPASEYSYPNTMFPTGGFYQTAPADLFQGPSWDTTAEGTQNFFDFPENGDAQDYVCYGPRQAQENLEVKAEAESMCRMASQSSSASIMDRTIRPTASKARPRLQTAMNAFEVTGNTHAFQEPPSHGPVMDMHAVSFPDQDQVLFPPALSLGMPEMSHTGLMDPSQMQLNHFDPNVVGSPSETTWDSLSHGHSPRTSSPGFSDDLWPVSASSPRTTAQSSPELSGQSRLSPKLGSGSVLGAEDLQGSVMNDEAFALPSPYGRRPSSEGESARDHPLYKNAFPQADGLFHCPWEGTSGCTHKPEKLKCNYDKFVDSHLKPYRCKVDSCENARFSSTACLLRHEREAHAMHGHGDKPYLCTYEGCDRAVPGNGFPRQWNLKDHMRRVHNDNGSSQNTSPQPAKVNKRKKETKTSSGRKSSKSSGSEGHSRRSSASKQPLINEWFEHHMVLQEMVNGMTKPNEMDTLNVIKNAQEQLSHLSNISQNLIYSHRRSFHTG